MQGDGFEGEWRGGELSEVSPMYGFDDEPRGVQWLSDDRVGVRVDGRGVGVGLRLDARAAEAELLAVLSEELYYNGVRVRTEGGGSQFGVSALWVELPASVWLSMVALMRDGGRRRSLRRWLGARCGVRGGWLLRYAAWFVGVVWWPVLVCAAWLRV
jgi:hypothetical protein